VRWCSVLLLVNVCSGETGVRLQYAHSRLYSLLQKAELALDLQADTTPLVEDTALDLVYVIGEPKLFYYRYRYFI
jgi:arginyl-tRNA synthetase